MEEGIVQITAEELKYLRKRDAQLEFALDMVPNLDDVLEQFEYVEMSDGR